MYSTDTANIKGAAGGWQLATTTFDNRANNLGKKCDGSAGNVRVTVGHPMMALWFENGDVSSAFVARDAVPGRPELNAMNTPLVMNSVQTGNAACSQNGAIAQDGEGLILSCQRNKWTPVGNGKCIPVDSTTDLNSLQEGGRCFNGAGMPNSPAGGEWVFIEVYRHYNAANYYTTQRVYGMSGASVGRTWTRTQQSGTPGAGWSSWNQVEDSQVTASGGNLTAAATVQGGLLYSSGGVTAAGTVQGNYLYTGNDVYAGNTVQGGFLYSRGHVDAVGNVTGNQFAARAGLRSFSTGEWGLVMGDSAGNLTSNPRDHIGSAHVNDIYLRSVGEWLSQRGKSLYMTGADGGYGTAVASCGGNQLVAGSCYGADTCNGNDSSGHGGYPSGNSWVCPYINCSRTYAYATCAY